MANVPFREIVSYAIGGGWGSENPSDGTVPVSIIRGTDFASLRMGRADQVPRRFEGKAKAQKRILRPDDVVLEISGGSPTSGQSTGRTILTKESMLADLGGLVIPASFCRLVRFDTAKVDPRYAYYSLQDMYLSGRAAEYEHRSTGISNFQFEYFLDQETIRLVPLPEQRAIAHVLGTLEDKIELNRRVNATLEAMAQAVFKAWFVDFDPVLARSEGRDPGLPEALVGLFPEYFEPSELGDIPAGWAIGRLGDFAEISSGKRPDVRYAIASSEADVPLWGGNGPMGFVRKPLTELPILLTGRVGTLGVVFRITTPCWPSDNTLIVRATAETAFEYLHFQLQHVDFGSLNRGSTQPLLTQGDLKAQPLLVPPAAVLAEFHHATYDLYRRIDVADAESRTLTTLRDALLPKLISGELPVPSAQRVLEAASV